MRAQRQSGAKADRRVGFGLSQGSRKNRGARAGGRVAAPAARHAHHRKAGSVTSATSRSESTCGHGWPWGGAAAPVTLCVACSSHTLLSIVSQIFSSGRMEKGSSAGMEARGESTRGRTDGGWPRRRPRTCTRAAATHACTQARTNGQANLLDSQQQEGHDAHHRHRRPPAGVPKAAAAGAGQVRVEPSEQRGARQGRGRQGRLPWPGLALRAHLKGSSVSQSDRMRELWRVYDSGTGVRRMRSHPPVTSYKQRGGKEGELRSAAGGAAHAARQLAIQPVPCKHMLLQAPTANTVRFSSMRTRAEALTFAPLSLMSTSTPGKSAA